MLKTVELLKSVMPAQRNAVVEIRPAALALDPNLSGIFRFAYARGNQPAIWTSSNQLTITEGVNPGDVELVTTDTVPEDWSDCLLVLDGSEHCWLQAQDQVTDDQGVETTTFSLATACLNAHQAGTRATLSAFRVSVVVGRTYAQGALVLELMTKRLIVAGDQLALMLNTEVPTLSRYMAVSNAVRTALDDDGRSTYTVTLSDPLLHDVDESTICFVQAQPAYESRKLPIPDHFRPGIVALDVHGGETLGKGCLTQVIRATSIKASGKVLLQSVAKGNDWFRLNHLQAHELACAVVDRGVLGWSGNQLTIELDSEGLAGIGLRFDESQAIVSDFVLHSSTTFAYWVDTALDQVQSWNQVQADVDTHATISVTSNVLVLRFRGTAGKVIRLWNSPKVALAASLQYTLRVELHENEVFESSGLLLKPMLPSALGAQTPQALAADQPILELNQGTALC